MSVANGTETPGDVIRAGDSDVESDYEPETEQEQVPEPVVEPAWESCRRQSTNASQDLDSQPSTSGHKRPHDEVEQAESHNTSPAATMHEHVPLRRLKQARRSTSPSNHTHRGSEEGEADESESDTNPRAALEKGKVVALASPAETTTSPALPVASASPASAPNRGPTSGHTTDQAELDELESFAGATMPSQSPTYTTGSLSLDLPVLSSKKQGSWPARFKDWVQVLCKHNLHNISAITPAVATDAFACYIDSHSGLRETKKKASKQAAKNLLVAGTTQTIIEEIKSWTDAGSQQPTVEPSAKLNLATPPTRTQDTNDGSAEEGEVSSNDSQPKPTQTKHSTQNGDTSIIREGVPTGAEELEQQRRYFPSAADPSVMCLLCGNEGHRAVHCSRAKCRFCQSFDHWDFCCPSIRKRCDKCRQLGHQATACVEKLAITADEGLACLYCKSSEHLEDSCTDIWRSFHPEEQTVHTVVYLPSSCAVCGGKDHLSGDCRQRRGVCANPTWSLQNRSLYMDSRCGTLSIEDAANPEGNRKSLRAPETKIRGHAARTANIHYSESEDSDVEFLGRKLSKAPKGGVAFNHLLANHRSHRDRHRQDRRGEVSPADIPLRLEPEVTNPNPQPLPLFFRPSLPHQREAITTCHHHHHHLLLLPSQSTRIGPEMDTAIKAGGVGGAVVLVVEEEVEEGREA
ncbi:zinc knuckle domain protein [Metarhizium album ARSEF 1941]|uniref:Zinc knuckle domain protein n=1 Tax=Metarhizium album (strain ARSEF 1941) TaxID=1081103 RepID=A0A0B2WZD2_METAS|nr:zinc knuckle domain protein [Metarhizium album ARSEF 1941]KHN99398.1 zinc knuckle domain protein [Metarhizium album ARSEF 1941]